MVKHVKLKRSSVNGKAPVPKSDLEYGELALNYNHEAAALFARADDDTLLRFDARPQGGKEGQVLAMHGGSVDITSDAEIPPGMLGAGIEPGGTNPQTKPFELPVDQGARLALIPTLFGSNMTNVVVHDLKTGIYWHGTKSSLRPKMGNPMTDPTDLDNYEGWERVQVKTEERPCWEDLPVASETIRGIVNVEKENPLKVSTTGKLSVEIDEVVRVIKGGAELAINGLGDHWHPRNAVVLIQATKSFTTNNAGIWKGLNNKQINEGDLIVCYTPLGHANAIGYTEYVHFAMGSSSAAMKAVAPLYYDNSTGSISLDISRLPDISTAP